EPAEAIVWPCRPPVVLDHPVLVAVDSLAAQDGAGLENPLVDVGPLVGGTDLKGALGEQMLERQVVRPFEIGRQPDTLTSAVSSLECEDAAGRVGVHPGCALAMIRPLQRCAGRIPVVPQLGFIACQVLWHYFGRFLMLERC